MIASSLTLLASGLGKTGQATANNVLSTFDYVALAIVVGSIVVFGGAAVLAMGWAFRTGQFENFQQGALSIFGPDEPVGEPTDAFPESARSPSDRG